MVRRRENINRVWWDKCQTIHNRNRAASEWGQLGKAQGLLYNGRSKRKSEAQTALVTVSVTLCPGWLLLLSFESDEMFVFGATGLQLSLYVLSQTRSEMWHYLCPVWGVDIHCVALCCTCFAFFGIPPTACHSCQSSRHRWWWVRSRVQLFTWQEVWRTIRRCKCVQARFVSILSILYQLFY